MDDGKSNKETWGQATRLVQGGTRRSQFDETSEGLFLTSGYVYSSPEEAERAFKGDIKRYQYSRYANPTVNMFEERLALLEGAEFCFATATGMAAVFASLACQVKQGSRIVAARALFGSCKTVIADLLTPYGVGYQLVDGTDMEQWKEALSKPADAVFLETPSNPTLEIIDIEAVAALAHKAGARLIVDNVFATPVLQRPMDYGADIVVYSTTKHIDGQGRCLGGAVATNDADYFNDKLIPFVRHSGPAMSPFNAWVMLKGLETLELRVGRHCDNAAEVARFLEGRGDVSKVIYPGLASHPSHELAIRLMSGAGGNIVTFYIPGGKAAAFRFLNALELIAISNNLGDAKTLSTHPATTTHMRLSQEERDAVGITDDLVRVSVGLEDAADIIADLEQALKAARG
mgnify:CR=1 FL=1